MKNGPSLAIRLTLYPLVLLAFILISAYMVFISAGYVFKFENGKITTEKTGIIIVGTRPGDAKVFIDGDEYEKKTSPIAFFKLKINRIPAGEHKVRIERSGYETWDGQVYVDPGFVSWLDYLILIPNERKAEAYNFPGSVREAITSSDQRRILVHCEDAKQGINTIWFVNAEDKTSQKIYEGHLSAKEKIVLVSLSRSGGRYLYKKTDAKGATAYMVSESKNGASPSNLNSLFGARPENFYFSPHNEAELYFNLAGVVYRINLDTKLQTAALVKDVVGIYPQEKKLLVIKKTDENVGLWELEENGNTNEVIKSLPVSGKGYEVTYIETKKTYLVRNISDGDLFYYENDSKNPTLETIGREVVSYVASPDGEKVAMYSGGQYRVYNLLKSKYFDTLKTTDTLVANWVQDSSNIVYTTKSGLYIVNFDGQYNKQIFPVNGAGFLLVTRNGHHIYFLSVAGGDADLNSFDL